MRATFLALLISATLGSAAESTPETFDLKASVQTQVKRKAWDDGKDNNLDAFWIRANFGAEYKADDFTGRVNVRLFGPVFGDKVVTAVKQDTNDAVSSTTATLHKIWIDALWGQYAWLDGQLTLKFGRWSTCISQSTQLGGYIDQDPKSDFQSRVFWHDAAELAYTAGVTSSALMLGIGDKNWNTGYVRFVETIKLPMKTELKAGYRANLIDRTQNEDAEIYHRIFGRAGIEVLPGFIPYTEVAMIDTEAEKQQVPVLFGVQVPTAGALDKLVLEAEIVKDRKVGNEDRMVDWNLSMERKLGRTKIVFAIYSDPTAESINDIELATRVTSTFK